MDVSIGRLHLAGRVVGPARQGPRPDVVDLLTGSAAQGRMLHALTSAFDGDEVLVIRSLTCSATVRADTAAGPESLARSIAASVSRLVRDHPWDDDCVVRFADETAYVAAYIHDCLDGHHRRWYFDAFEQYRLADGSTDWGALLAAHRHRRWRILARLRVDGDLETLLASIGDDGAAELAGDMGADDCSWGPLVATAAEIVGTAGGADRSHPSAPALTSALAMAEPPPDWLDPASLGRAVASAATGLLAAAGSGPAGASVGVDPATALAAARRHEWFDDEAFEAGFSGGRPGHRRRSPTRSDLDYEPPSLSPRTRQVLADLSETIADPGLLLDSDGPSSPTNLVRLFTALVDHAPRWHDDELARSLIAHVLRVWEQTGTSDPVSGQPAQARDAEPALGQASAASAEATRIGPPSDPTSAPAEPAAPLRHGRAPSEHPPTTAPDEASRQQPRRRPEPPSPRSVAGLLGARFPPADHHGAQRGSATASAMLLLRSVVDLGLAPYLLGVDENQEPVLAALLRRWAGEPWARDAADPLLALLGKLTPDHPSTVECPDSLGDLAARRMLGQRLVTSPFRLVTVPYAADELATAVIDSSSHVLPIGSLDGPEALRGPLDALSQELNLDLDAEPAGGDAQASLADALAAVAVGGGTGDMPQHELMLNLLAVACVQAWARWLPGFSDARVPFLLSTVVRRPARIEIDTSTITVHLPPRPHDIVLELAGYLEPLDAGLSLGRRRVRFVTGDQDGR